MTTIMETVNMEEKMDTLEGGIMVEAVVDVKEIAEEGVILVEVVIAKSIRTANICYQEIIKSLIWQVVSSYFVNNFDCKPLVISIEYILRIIPYHVFVDILVQIDPCIF